MWNIYSLFLCVIIIVGTCLLFHSVNGENSINHANEKPQLRFNENGSFKIAIFADLHYGEKEDQEVGPAHDLNTTRVMTDILKWEKPDFIAFSGDIIHADKMQLHNASDYVDILVKPAVDGGYKWASTYGNHDNGENVTREVILKTEEKYELSYTKKGPEGLVGTTNYFIPVYPPQNVTGKDHDKPALILWFFDSRGGSNRTGIIPSHVHESVVQWFKDQVKKMNETWGPIPGLAFFHYPTEPYKQVGQDIKDNKRKECPGLHVEGIYLQDKDSGFMQALLDSGVVKASYVGHVHGHGWCCEFKSMDLCFNRHTGYGGFWKGWLRGSRIVSVSYENRYSKPKTYVRLETQEVVDEYPQKPSTATFLQHSNYLTLFILFFLW